jgi:cell division septum initiation protein DivIVA
MDEGQKLSKRQLELEGSVKKLRQQLKASEGEREKLGALLAAESAEADSLRRAKAKAERDLVAAVEAGRQEVEAARQQAQADALNTQAEQVGWGVIHGGGTRWSSQRRTGCLSRPGCLNKGGVCVVPGAHRRYGEPCFCQGVRVWHLL